MILTGRRLDPDTALAWGLVSRRCADGEALASARALAAEVLHSAPNATRAVLPVLRSVLGMPDARAFEAETRAGIEAILGQEVTEGAQVFM
jgi:enoyl-CoA hydratase/carnithine racemase